MEISLNNESTSIFNTRSTLLQRLKEGGNESAWQEFYDIYGRLIFSYCLHFNISYAEAEDLVQEICIKIFRQILKFDYSPDRGRFRGWLKTITHNAAIDYLRRKQYRKRTASDYRIHLEIKQEVDFASTTELWQEEWEKALYEAALEQVRKRVGEDTFQVFQRYVLKNIPAQEVAVAAKLEVNAVYAVKHRVLRYLREEVSRIISEECDGRNEHA